MIAQVDPEAVTSILDNHGLAVSLVVSLLLFGMAFTWKFGGMLAIAAHDFIRHGFTRLVEYLDGQQAQSDCQTKLMQECTATLKTNQTNIETVAGVKIDPKGSDKYREHIFSTVHTNSAILSLSRAAREACKELSPDRQERITRHLDEIEKLLPSS